MLSDKKIYDSINQLEHFIDLSPQEQLLVLAFHIVSKGEIKNSHLDYWNSKLELYDKEIDYSTRIEFIEILVNDSKAENNLRLAHKYNLYEFCLRKYEPFGDRIARRDFEYLLKNLHKSKAGLDMKMSLIFFTLGKNKSIDIIKYYVANDQVRELMKFAIEKMDEYMLIKQPYLLKNFMFKYGNEKTDFINQLCEEIVNILDIPYYKHRSKTFMIGQINLYKEAVFLDDLKISDKSFSNLGINDSKKIYEIKEILLKHVHKYPKDNNFELLSKMARKIYESKLYSICIKNSIFKIR